VNPLGPTRPDRLTLWPIEAKTFGIDVIWRGAAGNRRATVAREQLTAVGLRAQLRQEPDGAWGVRLGPIPAVYVARVLDGFLY